MPALLLAPALMSVLVAPPAEPALRAEQRREAVQGLANNVRARYVLPELGARAAEGLLAKLAAGGYRQTRPWALAEALTNDLRQLTNDRHVSVSFDPAQAAPDAQPDPEAKDRERHMFARDNFGLRQVEVLPGNVGVLDLRFFAPEELAAPTLAAAMGVVANTEALILDLRQNGGGDPDTVAFLCSYFFPEGSSVHLNDVYDRSTDETEERWSRASVPGARYTDRPVYVLTSASTSGSGEELAYDLQASGRAAVVGESSAGNAGFGSTVAVGAGFVAYIPTGRSLNPVTRTSWAGEGVKPDVAAPAALALAAAHKLALTALLQAEQDPDRRRALAYILATMEREARPSPRDRGVTGRAPARS